MPAASPSASPSVTTALVVVAAASALIVTVLANGWANRASCAPDADVLRPAAAALAPPPSPPPPTVCDWSVDAGSPTCRAASRAALGKVARLLSAATRSDAGGLQFFGERRAALRVKDFGKGWGGHALVPNMSLGRPPGAGPQPCVFYSYGISHDYSFDEELARDWGCHGFLFDPSVVYPARMDHGLRFFYLAAPLLDPPPALSSRCEPGGQPCMPAAASPPRVMALFGHAWLSVLKMDCEGCEYALARDVAAADPGFFSRVGQFAVEVHVPRRFLKGEAELHFLGLLYHMLGWHGFELVQADIVGCSAADEGMGCLAELVELGYPCGSGRGCHNYLFARAA